MKIFIGSSSEGSDVATRISVQLQSSGNNIRPTVWKDGGVFEPSKTFLNQMVCRLDSYDFSIFVFSPDDEIKIRGEETLAVRDNVLFELGLFIGQMGVERTFIVTPEDFNIHIPTDLLGVTMLTYDAVWVSEDETCSPVSNVCYRILEVIKRMGSISEYNKRYQYSYSHAAAVCYRYSQEYKDYEFLLVKSTCGKYRGFPKKRISDDDIDTEVAQKAAFVEGGVTGEIKEDLGVYDYYSSIVKAFSLEAIAGTDTPFERHREPHWYSREQAIAEITKNRGNFGVVKNMTKFVEKIK